MKELIDLKTKSVKFANSFISHVTVQIKKYQAGSFICETCHDGMKVQQTPNENTLQMIVMWKC
jgi:hypothetical protein